MTSKTLPVNTLSYDSTDYSHQQLRDYADFFIADWQTFWVVGGSKHVALHWHVQLKGNMYLGKPGNE